MSESRATRDRVTLADVAAAAWVSVPTVSKVLNGHGDVAPRPRSRVEALRARLAVMHMPVVIVDPVGRRGRGARSS